MQKDNISILKITNIVWNKNSNNFNKLPKEIDLQWNSSEWTNKKVSIWLNKHFNAIIKDFNIENIENKENKEADT